MRSATRYEADRLYCTTCKKQPEFFLEEIHRPDNEAGRDGAYIDTRHGDVEYQCPQCFQHRPLGR